MTDLIARLKSAEAGSRELDADLALAFNPKFSGWIKHPNLKADSPAWMQGELWPSAEEFNEWLIRDGKPCSDYAPAYTTSLDAITALIGEKLPGWTWEVVSEGLACLRGHHHAHLVTIGARGKTAPLACAAALLRAFQKGEADG